MTGKDVKRQVMEAGHEVVNCGVVLDDPRLKYVEVQHGLTDLPLLASALAALVPCTVLTPEEALPILREAHKACGCDRPGNPSACIGEPLWAFALLSPNEAGDE